MEPLSFVFIWPFIVFILGLLYVSASSWASFLGVYLLIMIFLAILILIKKSNDAVKVKGEDSAFARLDNFRRSLVSVSVAFLLPIFVRYLVEGFDKTLVVIILGLVVGFGFTLWGMFAKSNKVLVYGNLFGGTLVLIYIYSQLWQLGDLPRIIAAAFGLAVAVVVSIIKLKDKLQ